MLRKQHLLCILVISSLIIQTFSTILLTLVYKNEMKVNRIIQRNQSVHRGALFSYSEEEKNQLCQDYFYAQLNEEYFDTEKQISNRKVTDEPTNMGKPQHTLEVKLFTNDKKPQEDIFLKCSILGVTRYKPREDVYLVSSAFQPSWFYISTFDKQKKLVKLDHYMGRSPERVELKQNILENQYVTMWQMISALQAESPEYAELIKKKNSLSRLTRHQRQLLCASILSTPHYRKERLLAAKMIFEINKKKTNFNEIKISQLIYYNNRDDNRPRESNCIPCFGFVYSIEPPLCVTGSFDDQYSVYILTKYMYEHNWWVLTEYFKNVPILMNAHDPITEGQIFKNFLKDVDFPQPDPELFVYFIGPNVLP